MPRKEIKHVMDYATVVAVADVIKAHCKRTETGSAVYDEGWNDERVAKETGVTIANATSLRFKLIGTFNKPAQGFLFDQRLAAVEEVLRIAVQDISRLREWAAKRPVHPYKESA